MNEVSVARHISCGDVLLYASPTASVSACQVLFSPPLPPHVSLLWHYAPYIVIIFTNSSVYDLVRQRMKFKTVKKYEYARHTFTIGMHVLYMK